MKIVLKIAQRIYWLYAAILFVITMFLAFPFVVVASFFGRIRGGNMIYQICGIWDDVWSFLVGIHHENIMESPVDPDSSYIFVANHVSYVDIPVIIKAIRKQPFRVLGKSEIRKIPVFGYIYGKAVVMVDRNNPADRSKSVRTIKSVLKKKISIVIFPEGTFNESGRPLKEFYDGAFRIAIEMQTPIKPILFLDSYARMPSESFFSLNPGLSRAVFLKEFPVEGLTMADLPSLKRKVFKYMEDKLLVYKASWIKPRAEWKLR